MLHCDMRNFFSIYIGHRILYSFQSFLSITILGKVNCWKSAIISVSTARVAEFQHKSWYVVVTKYISYYTVNMYFTICQHKSSLPMILNPSNLAFKFKFLPIERARRVNSYQAFMFHTLGEVLYIYYSFNFCINPIISPIWHIREQMHKTVNNLSKVIWLVSVRIRIQTLVLTTITTASQC